MESRPIDRRIALLVNPLAGSGRASRLHGKLSSLLQAKGIAFVPFSDSWPENFGNFTDVWIVGGDGTLNYFINHYPGITQALAIFKGGSGNDFHWMLYGETDQEVLASRLLMAPAVAVDAGHCNGRLFLNGVGIGFDGAVAASVQKRNKPAGKSAFMRAVLRHIFFFRSVEMELVTDGQSQRGRWLMINVMNGKRAGGGFHVSPEASVSDGKLDMNMLQPLPWWKRILLLPRIEKGTHLNLSCIRYSLQSKVLVRTARIVPAHLDGEAFKDSEFRLEVLPAKFRFRI